MLALRSRGDCSNPNAEFTCRFAEHAKHIFFLSGLACSWSSTSFESGSWSPQSNHALASQFAIAPSRAAALEVRSQTWRAIFHPVKRPLGWPIIRAFLLVVSVGSSGIDRSVRFAGGVLPVGENDEYYFIRESFFADTRGLWRK